MNTIPKILFLCTGGATRSQMAQGFVSKLAGNRVNSVSAAVESPVVDPLAVESMKEVGIDISPQGAKPVSEIFKVHFAYVVGICQMPLERCPIFPFTYRVVKWDVADPSKTRGSQTERLAAFRRARSIIEKNTKELLNSVLDNSSAVPQLAR